ncbi:MAG: tRNA (adenosine(37)-N6)-threonylcarbamoyltransferase complex dimerization subunit type 1 TsaB [Cyanobacteria bacterium]|nr:tRNA (adenosine(37)-N6)-threonylcarbamoyltransferase complex dimerization subunit type 1 TsaB [Cyanobacteria bacterium CG_2015-09_32_10]
MKILSINNAFQPSITAFSENEKIIFSITAYQKDDWPNNILYVTKTMFDSLGIAPKDIELVSVVYGPGSFTGTRVGVIEGKITSYALNIPIVPVNSLKFIAAHFKEEVHPILPAGKNEYFIAIMLKLKALTLTYTKIKASKCYSWIPLSILTILSPF